MPISTPELDVPAVSSVSIGRQRLIFNLADGRSVSAPLEWFPRLTFGTDRERRNCTRCRGKRRVPSAVFFPPAVHRLHESHRLRDQQVAFFFPAHDTPQPARSVGLHGHGINNEAIRLWG